MHFLNLAVLIDNVRYSNFSFALIFINTDAVNSNISTSKSDKQYAVVAIFCLAVVCSLMLNSVKTRDLPKLDFNGHENMNKILVGKLEGSNHFKDLDVDGTIICKWILEKMEWIGFI